MPRQPILGQIDPDLACAIAVGFVEHSRIGVNLNAVTLHDESMRTMGTKEGWLDAGDPLDAATRDYLTARRDALLAGSRGPGNSAWGAATTARKRDEANRRALQAKERVRELLEERGVLETARSVGMHVRE